MTVARAYALYYGALVRSVRQRAAVWGLSERDVDVEALVQDTIEVPRAWLSTVAMRCLGRCIPAAARRAEGDPSDHTEEGTVTWSILAPSASTEDLLAAREVVGLIQRMPQQRHQEVAYLRYLEEWGHSEIVAEQLGCRPATIRARADRRQ
ncbi:hypothetical protein OG285_00040 [Streptomyces sp. NBC_01471]|uniref:RNA polymerase sigma factor n=1 Tax=Streptomyces sp. NBC_01471 TaxID=2903879 RepID=UPI0032494CB5